MPELAEAASRTGQAELLKAAVAWMSERTAREQLRGAREALLSMGADGFAERARHELLATGEKVRTRRADTRAS